MTKSYADTREGLLRERDARAAAYGTAVAERDVLASAASAGDVLPFDRALLARANSRVGLSLHEMQFWGDPLPAAATNVPTALDPAPAPLGLVASAVGTPIAPDAAPDTLEATVARIMEA